jgi:hypothetical protein
MKILKWFSAIVFVVLSLTACDPTDRVIWSPDGKKCAVISSDGLRICDADGKLSASLMDMEDVEVFRWLPDSKQALIVVEEKTTNWKEISQLLSASQRARVMSQSEQLWRLRGTKGWPGQKNDKNESASFLYLKFKYGEKAVKAVLPKEYKQYVSIFAEPIHSLQLFRFLDDKVVPGSVLLRTVNDIADVRLGPAAKLAAMTEVDEGGYKLEVVPVSGGSARTVTERAGKHAEWSRDGRALYFTQANKTGAHSRQDQASAVTLMRQEIADYDEKLLARFSPPLNLVELPHQDATRIRCLAGGDIIFDAKELHLPKISEKSQAKNSNSEPRLFRLSRDFQILMPVSLSGDPLGDKLSDFEINQDGTKVVVPGSKGEVTVVDLTTGKVTALEQKGIDLKFAPQWRSADELCYPARSVPGGGHDVDVVLQSVTRTEAPRLLSKDWPAASIKFLNDPKKDSSEKAPAAKSSSGSHHR